MFTSFYFIYMCDFQYVTHHFDFINIKGENKEI